MSNREIIEWLKKKAEAVPMPGARKMYEAAAKALEAAQPELGTNLASLGTDCISRQAVKHLDLFTKTYCRDKSVKDNLVFRCNQCDFQLPDGICLVKTMARKLCPDYREFGSMGDL